MSSSSRKFSILAGLLITPKLYKASWEGTSNCPPQAQPRPLETSAASDTLVPALRRLQIKSIVKTFDVPDPAGNISFTMSHHVAPCRSSA